MDEHFLSLRVTYDDLSGKLELSVRVVHDEWSAASRAYASPSFFSEKCKGPFRWVDAPNEPLRIEAGAGTG